MVKQVDKEKETSPENEQEETQVASAEAKDSEAADTEDEAQKKYDALNEKYMRILAEYDNYRKRSIREKESIYPDAKASAVAAFLPVIDNLEQALAVETEKNAFYQGVELIKKQFEDILKNFGVEVIEAGEGTPFDPGFHNAVMHIEDENLSENVIVEEFQKGYKMGGRILRHSMVKVAN